MKIIDKNYISAVASSGTAMSSVYAVANMLTDYPGQAYIDNAGVSSSITVTATLSATSAAFFLHNWLADVLEYSIDAGANWVSLSTADQNFISSNPQFFLNSRILTKSFFISVSMTTGNGLKIRMQSTTDRKSSQVEGNAIANWVQDSAATGHFTDSTPTTVSLESHGRVMLGSIVTIAASNYQITKIIGDGTASGAITLSSAVASAAVSSIKNPCKLGILRAGSLMSIENATPGFSAGFSDYSFQSEIQNGGFTRINRNVARIYDFSISATITNSDAIIAFARAYRKKPFACLLLDGMPSGQNETKEFSVFATISQFPNMTFWGYLGTLRNITLRLIEVL